MAVRVMPRVMQVMVGSPNAGKVYDENRSQKQFSITKRNIFAQNGRVRTEMVCVSNRPGFEILG